MALPLLKLKKMISKIKDFLFLLSRKITWKFGFVLLPIEEVNWIEQDGIDYMQARNKNAKDTEIYGYFSGMSDYALKKSANLRKRYFLN